jgi:hypothetical protein
MSNSVYRDNSHAEGLMGHAMTVADVTRSARPGDLFRVTRTHFRPDDFTVLNKGATALIVSCVEASGRVEAVVTDPAKGSREIHLSSLEVVEGEFWERCENE